MRTGKLLLVVLISAMILAFGCNNTHEQGNGTPDNDDGDDDTDLPSKEPPGDLPSVETGAVELAFLRNYDIWLLADNREQQLTDEGDISFMQWSPDGQKILYFRGHGTTGDLWVMDADGSNQQQLAQGVFMQYQVTLAPGLCWHPSGERVAFLQGDSLVIQDLNGDQKTQVALNYDYYGGPWWHPGGETLIVWGANSDYTANAYFYGADGTPGAVRELVSSPFWSDDGLFFVQEVLDPVSGYLQAQGVYSVDPRGENQRAVYEGNLAWSPLVAVDPTGRRLAVSDARNVHVLTTDGFTVEFSVESEIVNTRSEFAHPFWFAFAPHGDRLAVMNYYLEVEGEQGDDGYWLLRVYDIADNYRGLDVWPRVYELYGGADQQPPVPMQGIQPFFWSGCGENLLVLRNGESEYDLWLVTDVLTAADYGEGPVLANISQFFIRP
ncbi:MAG: hypothetical protein FH749_01075 [Firmicutes bacterium]|nr:hypothetical protein [Bacillota bacterium]